MHCRIACLLAMLFGLALTSCVTTSSTLVGGVSSPPPPAATYPEAQPFYQAIDTLAAKLVASMSGGGAGKIAVADFVGPGSEIHVFGELLADKLGVRLFGTGAFAGYMERKQLKEVIRAQAEEQQSGYFDQQTVKKLGIMIGVDSMVIGSVKDLGSIVDVTARIVESGSGRILGMADVSIIKDATVSDMLHRQRTATLTVSVDPPVTGTVTAAGQSVSLANGMAMMNGIPYGQCTLIIHPQGHASVRRAISIRSENETFGVRLEKIRYDVSFQILPPDAILVVDGNKIDVSTDGFAKLSDLENREYGYSVSAEGYSAQMASFNPSQGQLVQINMSTTDPLYTAKDTFFQKAQKLQSNQSFQVKIWTDKSHYRLKENITFSFRAEEDCYLNLVDINSKGEISLLFPNEYHRNNWVQGGSTYSIPDEGYGFMLKAQKPIGTDRVYAIASRRPLNIFSDDYANGFKTVTRGMRGWVAEAKSISDRLNDARFDAVAQMTTHIRP